MSHSVTNPGFEMRRGDQRRERGGVFCKTSKPLFRDSCTVRRNLASNISG